MTRRGSVLLELLVSMTLLAIIGTAAASAIRMQSGVRLRIAARVAAGMQRREAIAPLAADLARLSPSDGDIPAGGATDSTLEIRATVGGGALCAQAPGDSTSAWLSPIGSRRTRRPEPGDTVWLYLPPQWVPRSIVEVAEDAAPAACPSGMPSSYRLRVDGALPQPMPLGTPLRVTRRQRFSFYRSGSATYLGLREWSQPSAAFTTVQPVAGPFDRAGSGFAYFTDGGVALQAPVAEPARIAAVGIRIGAVALRNVAGSAPAYDTVIVALRNR